MQPLTIFGTRSDAGKTTVTMALCRFIGVILCYREAEIQQFAKKVAENIEISNLLEVLQAES
jgi:cobyric acid synthase